MRVPWGTPKLGDHATVQLERATHEERDVDSRANRGADGIELREHLLGLDRLLGKHRSRSLLSVCGCLPFREEGSS